MRTIETTVARTKATIREFDSLSEWSSYIRANLMNAKGIATDEQRPAWYGARPEDALRFMVEGDLSTVDASDSLLAKFENIELATSRRAITDDVVGAFPNVPAYLAGHPLSMRRRRVDETAYAPIRIYADVFASVGFTPDQIRARGAAVLALVRLLSGRRPVELYAGLCTSSARGGGSFVACLTRIDTAPLDLARACFALTHPAFLRRITFATAREIGARHSIPNVDEWPRRALLAPALGDNEIVVLPPMVSAQTSTFAAQKWIEEQLRAIAPETFADAA